MNEDVVSRLAGNIVRVEYDDLPAGAVEAARKSVLDTIGVIEAASGAAEGVRPLIKLVKEGGGKRESTILGFGGRVPAWMAAFANGAMTHCLDYDDHHQFAGGHPSANTVPSGFAVAERLGKVTGKQLITAIALGNDLFCRLGSSVSLKYKWHKTPLFGVFAAAATSGKLLQLNEDQMVDALGLAFCQSAGTLELRYGVGSDIGGMRDAFPNKGGVLAALMAQRGVHGVKTCLEGKAGFYNVYFGGEYDREALTAGLGKRFLGAEVGFKPWPACAATQAYIDCALKLVAEHDIRPEDVEEIIVYVGDVTQNLCQPLEARRRPATAMDAKYSIPFTTAVAVARRKVVIHDYSPERLKDPLVLDMAQKVTPKLDKEYNNIRGRKPSKVEIRTKNGRTYSKRTDFPYGHPENPMTMDDLVNKFRDCLSQAAKPVSANNVEKVIDIIGHLDEVEDAGQIIKLLCS